MIGQDKAASIYADDLALLAFRSQDAAVRASARETLHREAENADSILEQTVVAKLISETKGDAFSPFGIPDGFLEIAIDLVQLAISKKHGKSRLRIVSSDTIGTAGGLTIFQSGNVSYVKPSRRARRSRVKSCFVAPRESVSIESLERHAESTLDWDGNGYSISVNGNFRTHCLAGDHYKLQRYSHLVKPRRSFDSLGLRIDECRGGGLRITTGSPESLMQFTAICAVPTKVVLRNGSQLQAGTKATTFVIPSLDHLPARISMQWERESLPWANVPILIAVDASSPVAATTGGLFGEVDFRPEEEE